MKNIGLVVILVALSILGALLSCNSQADMETNNKAIVTQAFEAIDRQDYEVLSQYFAQDIHVYVLR